MAIDEGGPPIDREEDRVEPRSLRGELLDVVRREAFKLYVNRGGFAGEHHIAAAHAFADAIAAAITVEVFDDALRGRAKAAGVSLVNLVPSSPVRH